MRDEPKTPVERVKFPASFSERTLTSKDQFGLLFLLL